MLQQSRQLLGSLGGQQVIGDAQAGRQWDAS
jgi:hypothetical protein